MLRLLRTAAWLEFMAPLCLIAPATSAFPQAPATAPGAAHPRPQYPRLCLRQGVTRRRHSSRGRGRQLHPWADAQSGAGHDGAA